MPGTDKPAPLTWLRALRQRRAESERQWRAAVDAQRLDGINRLARLGDAELIATMPTIPLAGRQRWP
jgi:hypothetical protein